MLEISKLEVAYGRTQVLFGSTLDVGANELVALLGRNGVGKSTLMKATMGLMKSFNGTVTFEGEDITGLSPSQRVKRGIAYVPQGRMGFPQLSVMDNMKVVLEATSHKQASAIDEALDLFPRLKPILSRDAGFLSGGQKQQLAIARALITRPKLILLDEPTEGIQPSIIHEIEAAIAEMNKASGLSILLVEQHLEFALSIGDRYALMEHGEVVSSGPADAAATATVRELIAV
ncbi:MAG: urea ABC transporter ATP-binding subunit UrtE [Solirubrobacteraceae bacterium]|nr:urea ABC transporter ATP-binding subunit UrtE [Solirubrobacteraceae bacterium]